MTIPRVLSIAGTDPTGGAGIQADIKAICEAGGFAMTVVTALVAQNTHGVREIHTPDTGFLTAQLDAVFDDVTVDAVKIGMLGTADITRTVTGYLREHRVPVLVVDPVMVATSGDRLLTPDAEAALADLCRLADVITPNLAELAVLAGTSRATTLDEALEQGCRLAADLDTTVIVKGGHLSGASADNSVVTPDGGVHTVPVARVSTNNTHGTGCSLSSALTTRLAAGDSTPDALTWATGWLAEAIRYADDLHVGSAGRPHPPLPSSYGGRRHDPVAAHRLSADGAGESGPAGRDRGHRRSRRSTCRPDSCGRTLDPCPVGRVGTAVPGHPRAPVHHRPRRRHP